MAAEVGDLGNSPGFPCSVFLVSENKKESYEKQSSAGVIRGRTFPGLYNRSRSGGGKSQDDQGEGVCAKCSLKEASACQNAIKVKEASKTVTYYLVHNQVSKDFHQNICTSTAKVVATGTVKEVNGKLEMTPTKIELDK